MDIDQACALSSPVVQPMLIGFDNVKLTVSIDSTIDLSFLSCESPSPQSPRICKRRAHIAYRTRRGIYRRTMLVSMVDSINERLMSLM